MSESSEPGGFDFSAADWSTQPVFLWGGVEVIEQASGRAVLAVTIDDHHRGGGGTDAVNGAFLAYIADLLLGTAASTAWGETPVPQVTVGLNIAYLSPLRGASIYAEAKVRRAGRLLCFIEGTMMDESGEVCLVMSGTGRRIQGS